VEEKTKKALHWIVKILDKHKVPYRIGGGFAAHVYGSTRPIKDIDVTFPGKYFPIIIPEVSEHITHDFKHYSDKKWDCDGLTLNYDGQEIDMTDIDTLRMSNKEQTEWFQTKNKFRNFNPIPTDIDSIKVLLIDPRDLAAYKKHLDGNHQLVDIEAVEKYITSHGLNRF
jgi:hypothetical protein